MIRHIVILQFKKTTIDYLSLLEKTRPLLKEIPGILKYSIYPNKSKYTPENQISIGIEILFQDKNALDGFMKHPKHFEANAIFEGYLADPPYMVLTHEEEYSHTNSLSCFCIKFIDEIWNRANFSQLDKFIFSKYTIHHDPGDPWEFQTLDLDTFKKRVVYARAVFPDLHFTVEETIAGDDKISVRWHFQGTHKGDLPQLKATGKRVTVSGITIYCLTEGKISGHWQIMDRLGLLNQLGIELI